MIKLDGITYGWNYLSKTLNRDEITQGRTYVGEKLGMKLYDDEITQG